MDIKWSAPKYKTTRIANLEWSYDEIIEHYRIWLNKHLKVVCKHNIAFIEDYLFSFVVGNISTVTFLKEFKKTVRLHEYFVHA